MYKKGPECCAHTGPIHLRQLTGMSLVLFSAILFKGFVRMGIGGEEVSFEIATIILGFP